MKKHGLHLILCLFCLLFISCSTVHLTSGGFNRPASMNSIINEKYEVVKHFSVETKGWFTLASLYTFKDTNVQKILQNELDSVQGDAIVNVKIKGQTTFVDSVLPMGLYCVAIAVNPYLAFVSFMIPTSRTYTIEGDVIKYFE